MKKNIGLLFLVLILVGLRSEAVLAQAKPVPEVYIEEVLISAAGFETTLPPSEPGEPGVMHLDTDSWLTTDEYVPVPWWVMYALSKCKKKLIIKGEVDVKPEGNETHKQAAARVIGTLIAKHLRTCHGDDEMAALGLAVAGRYLLHFLVTTY